MPHNIFRCYAYRNKEGYYAICLDLLLIVRRDTLDEAVSELREVIIVYLESVMAHDGGKAITPPWGGLGGSNNWKAENGKLTYA